MPKLRIRFYERMIGARSLLVGAEYSTGHFLRPINVGSILDVETDPTPLN